MASLWERFMGSPAADNARDFDEQAGRGLLDRLVGAADAIGDMPGEALAKYAAGAQNPQFTIKMAGQPEEVVEGPRLSPANARRAQDAAAWMKAGSSRAGVESLTGPLGPGAAPPTSLGGQYGRSVGNLTGDAALIASGSGALARWAKPTGGLIDRMLVEPFRQAPGAATAVEMAAGVGGGVGGELAVQGMEGTEFAEEHPIATRVLGEVAGSMFGGVATARRAFGPGAEPVQPASKEVPASPTRRTSEGPFETAKEDASYISPGAQEITLTHKETGGKIVLVERTDGTVAVLGLEVPEASRRRGVGKSLQKYAQELYPELSGQVSSKYAAKSAYDLGRRPPGNPNATLDDVYRAIDEDSSVNLVAQPETTPRASEGAVYYRGTREGGERSVSGDKFWDEEVLFAADTKEAASLYAGAEGSVEQITFKPGSRILKEGTKEFVSVAGRWRKGENLLEFASRASQAAKEAGYDAVHFKRQSDVGTAILNESAVVRSAPAPRAAEGAAGSEGTPVFVENSLSGGKAFDAAEGDPYVWVFHSTDNETADAFLTGGVRSSEKPVTIGGDMAARGEIDYAPGRGAGDGLYVGGNTDSIPHSRRFLAIKVRRSELGIPPESSALGYDTAGGALNSQGAVIRGNVPAGNVVDVTKPGFSPRMGDITEQLSRRTAPAAREVPAPAGVREPWQMTRAKFDEPSDMVWVFRGASSTERHAGKATDAHYVTTDPALAANFAGPRGSRGGSPEDGLSAFLVPRSALSQSPEDAARGWSWDADTFIGPDKSVVEAVVSPADVSDSVTFSAEVANRMDSGLGNGHRLLVERAIAEGKPVRAEVLAQYPDLPTPAPLEPLGLNRVPMIDPELSRLGDEAFEQRRLAVTREVDGLEQTLDADPSLADVDSPFRRNLAGVQDEYDAVMNESWRRDTMMWAPEELAHQMLQLGNTPGDKVKALLLSDSVNKRGLADSMKQHLAEYAGRSPDHAEILSGKLSQFSRTVNEATDTPLRQQDGPLDDLSPGDRANVADARKQAEDFRKADNPDSADAMDKYADDYIGARRQIDDATPDDIRNGGEPAERAAAGRADELEAELIAGYDKRLPVDHHRRLTAATKELFELGEVKRNPNVMIHEQVLELLETGVIKREVVQEILDRNNLTINQLAGLTDVDVGDAARVLNAYSQASKIAKKMAQQLGHEADDLVEFGSKPRSFGDRIEGIRLGLITSQLYTAVRNALSAGPNIVIHDIVDGLEHGLMKTLGRGDYNPDKAFKGMSNTLRVLSSPKVNARHVDELLAMSPKLKQTFYQRYGSEAERAFQGGDGPLSRAEKIVDGLQVFNRFQDALFRKAVVASHLDRLLAKRGTSLKQLEESGQLGTITKDELRPAIKEALELTYAKQYKAGAGNQYEATVGHIIKGIQGAKIGPLRATHLVPFPRFMAQALEWQYKMSPHHLATLFDPRTMKKMATGSLDEKTANKIARGMAGGAMFTAAYQARSAQPAYTKWHETEAADGRIYNWLAFAPLSASMWHADLAMRALNSYPELAGAEEGEVFGNGAKLDSLTTKDFSLGLLSVNARAGMGAYALDKSLSGLTETGNLEDFLKVFKTYTGTTAASFLTPFNQVKDMVAAFDRDQRVSKDTKEDPLFGPAMEKIPYLRDRLPDLESGTQEANRMQTPLKDKFRGMITSEPRNEAQKELGRLGVRTRVSEGDPKANRLVNKHLGPLVEKKIGRFIARESYQKRGDNEKRVMLEKYVSGLKKRARAKAFRDDRELFREVRKRRRGSRSSRALLAERANKRAQRAEVERRRQAGG